MIGAGGGATDGPRGGVRASLLRISVCINRRVRVHPRRANTHRKTRQRCSKPNIILDYAHKLMGYSVEYLTLWLGAHRTRMRATASRTHTHTQLMRDGSVHERARACA